MLGLFLQKNNIESTLDNVLFKHMFVFTIVRESYFKINKIQNIEFGMQSTQELDIYNVFCGYFRYFFLVKKQCLILENNFVYKNILKKMIYLNCPRETNEKIQ